MRTLHTLPFVTVVLFTAIAVIGCAPSFHKPLELGLSDNEYKVNILSTIKKDEITVRFEPSELSNNYSQGIIAGMLYVAIDSAINKARAKKVEKVTAALYEATAGIDFRSQYWTALEESLNASPWLKMESFDKNTSGYAKEELLAFTPPLFDFNVIYEISADCQVVVVRTTANLYLEDLNKPDYFGT